MGTPVMEDARATPICTHLHDNASHTHFWEEFIDKGRRRRGRVINISYCVRDLVGQSRPPVHDCVCPSTSVCVSKQQHVV